MIRPVAQSKPYVIPINPKVSRSYGYALVNNHFKQELEQGHLAPQMLHALMRVSWEQSSDVPVLDVSLSVPAWLRVRAKASLDIWADIFIGRPINGTVPSFQEHITAFHLLPGQRFTLAFQQNGMPREKYSGFHYNNSGLVCWLLDFLMIVPQNKPGFQANPILQERFLQLP